jgi:outer membrane protein assembly factor BamB
MRLGIFSKKCLPVLLGIVLLSIGGFVVLKRNPSYPVPVLWKADVGPYLDTSTPFVLGPNGGLLASTYTNLLELDRAGVLRTNVTRGVHGFRFPRPIAVEADGTFYYLFHGQGAQATLRAQKPDGSELWQTTAFRLSRSAPPVMANDGTIYFTARSNLVALSRSGQVKWSFAADASLYRPASLGPDGSIYLVSAEHLYCLNSEGSLQWDLRGSGWYDTPAVASDGTVYVRGGSTNLTLTAIQPDGEVAWTYSNARHHGVTEPVIGPDGSIHVLTTDSWLETISPEGSLKWELQLGEYRSMQAPVVARDGTVFVASADPKVTAVGPDGDVKWVFEVPKKGDFRMPQNWNGMKKIIRERFGFAKPILVSRPLLALDGTLYVGFAQQYGSIYALSTGKNPFFGK